ncbi:MAG TPA: hypothetical protein VNN77_16945 [candidate division Zixibacteria bacterium]|nr:hypothetical protein [candidate division Zixibacteria bacterium]
MADGDNPEEPEPLRNTGQPVPSFMAAAARIVCWTAFATLARKSFFRSAGWRVVR